MSTCGGHGAHAPGEAIGDRAAPFGVDRQHHQLGPARPPARLRRPAPRPGARLVRRSARIGSTCRCRHTGCRRSTARRPRRRAARDVGAEDADAAVVLVGALDDRRPARSVSSRICRTRSSPERSIAAVRVSHSRSVCGSSRRRRWRPCRGACADGAIGEEQPRTRSRAGERRAMPAGQCGSFGCHAASALP